MRMIGLAMGCMVAGMVVVEGCAPSDDESATATTTSALQVQSQTGITDGVLETEGTLAPEPDAAAKVVADHPMPNVVPAGCASKTVEGNVVTLKLERCTGPFGKIVLEGSLVATFSKTADDVLHVAIATADGMKANDGPLVYAADVDIRYDGSQRTLTYHGHSNGTTKRGVSYERHTDATIIADVTTHCGQIDGVSKGSVGRYDIDLSVQGLKGCRNQCPTAGVAHATVDGPLVKSTAIDVTFDGSSSAHVLVSGKKQRDLDVALDCDNGEAAE
jgi:hypothetical protein